MNDSPLKAGSRVVVARFAESPPEAIETVLSLEPMAPPDPSRLAARDVIVEVRSAAVGWVDLLMTSGQYQHMPKPPYTPGLECAGVVAWVGPEARGRIAVGDAVIVDGLLAGPRSLGAYQAWGGFASYVVAPVEAAIKIPGGLSFDQAAALLGSYETAYHCLVTRGRLRAGETVLIHGASGATGLAAVQVAKLLGATVIATGRSPAKLAVVAMQGADHVLDSSGSFRDEVKRLTSGRGVDVVYDAVGKDTFEQSLACLRPRGLLALYGEASGLVPPIDVRQLLMAGSVYVTRTGLNAYAATPQE
ncbi:MAG: zinc-binding dehydrogenase, partial [Polyangia bacterium]